MAIAKFTREMVLHGAPVDGAPVFKNADDALHQHLDGLAKAGRDPILLKLGQGGAHLWRGTGGMTSGPSSGKGAKNPNPFTGCKNRGFPGVGRLVASFESATEAYDWTRTHFPSAEIKEHGGFHDLLQKERASIKPKPSEPASPPPPDDRLDNLLARAEHILQQIPQLILQGPPGTGKTYAAKRLAARLLGIDKSAVDEEEKRTTGHFHSVRFSEGRHGGCWDLVQFHPAYAYDDFVRGIQASTDKDGNISYEVVRRVLERLVEHHLANPNSTTVLIIDEINRANLAQVLGELIYALEYRGSPVRSLYQIKQEWTLTIPREKFYVIGTMNTADRSIGRIDYAVRRRFAFLQLDPKAEVIVQQNKVGEPDKVWAKDLFECVGALFDEGRSRRFLAQEFHPDDVRIGHTYFLGGRSEVKIKFAYQVYPLLREYYKDGVLLAQTGELRIALPAGGVIDLVQPDDSNVILSKLDQSWAARETNRT